MPVSQVVKNPSANDDESNVVVRNFFQNDMQLFNVQLQQIFDNRIDSRMKRLDPFNYVSLCRIGQVGRAAVDCEEKY